MLDLEAFYKLEEFLKITLYYLIKYWKRHNKVGTGKNIYQHILASYETSSKLFDNLFINNDNNFVDWAALAFPYFGVLC